MKKILVCFLSLMFANTILAQRQASEIFFSQDSLLSNKIYANIKMLAEPDYTGNIRDSLNIFWGDGSSSWILVSDTVQVSGITFSLYDATYTGFHSYDSTYLDSTITIGCITYWPREQDITNMSNSLMLKEFIEATINFSMLKNTTGYQSPYFAAPLFTQGTTLHSLIYNPQYICLNSNYTQIQFVTPFQENGVIVPGYIPANEILPSGLDTLLICDSMNGLLTWNYPFNPGLYDIAMKTSQYQNDVLISSVMLDMTIAIVSASGFTDIQIDPLLRCYPSPSLGKLTIDMNGFDDIGKKQVVIYDQLGQIVYQVSTSQDKVQVSDKLSSGIYTVSVTQDSRREYERVVVE